MSFFKMSQILCRFEKRKKIEENIIGFGDNSVWTYFTNLFGNREHVYSWRELYVDFKNKKMQKIFLVLEIIAF